MENMCFHKNILELSVIFIYSVKRSVLQWHHQLKRICPTFHNQSLWNFTILLVHKFKINQNKLKYSNFDQSQGGAVCNCMYVTMCYSIVPTRRAILWAVVECLTRDVIFGPEVANVRYKQ